MTKSEKRYFKLFNSTFDGKNKTNLKLFNAIDKQKEYDEKALKEKFGSENFVKHFAVVKSNLFNSILKVLRIYHDNSNNRRKINQHQENYLILFEKGLTDLARNQLDKAMKLANECDFIVDKVLINDRYNALNAYSEFRNNKNKDVQQIFIKPLKHLEELNERYQYKYISQQIDFLVLQNTIRLKKTQEEISRILKLPEMQADKKPRSCKATYIKYHNLISCYVGQKDFEKAYAISTQIIDFALKSIKDNKLEAFKILNDYNNILHIAVRLASHKKVKQLMEVYFNALQNLKNITLPDLEERVFEVKYFYELEYHILNNKFEEAIKLMPIIESEFPKVKDKITDFMYNHFNYNFAYLYFMYGDYSKSQQYVIKLTNSPN